MSITKLDNHRIFKVKCHGATNHRGSRISITEKRLDKSQRKQLSWSDRLPNKELIFTSQNVINGVEKYLNSIGINCVGVSSIGNVWYIFSDSWANEKNEFITIHGNVI